MCVNKTDINDDVLHVYFVCENKLDAGPYNKFQQNRWPITATLKTQFV